MPSLDVFPKSGFADFWLLDILIWILGGPVGVTVHYKFQVQNLVARCVSGHNRLTRRLNRRKVASTVFLAKRIHEHSLAATVRMYVACATGGWGPRNQCARCATTAPALAGAHTYLSWGLLKDAHLRRRGSRVECKHWLQCIATMGISKISSQQPECQRGGPEEGRRRCKKLGLEGSSGRARRTVRRHRCCAKFVALTCLTIGERCASSRNKVCVTECRIFI